MAAWWSGQADGKTIFYKLPEHLSTYHKKWLERRNISQSMVASEPMRQPNTRRIRSRLHIAQVLNPATQAHPGVFSTAENIVVQQSYLEGQDRPEISSTDIPDSPDAQDCEVLHPEQSIASGSSHGSGLHNINIDAPSSFTPAYRFRPAVLTYSHMPSIGQQLPFFPQPKDHSWVDPDTSSRTRRCAKCVIAGRDGSDCPGKTKRIYCKYPGM